jgi:hypothetical protein
MNSPTEHIVVECLLDTSCLFAKADVADDSEPILRAQILSDSLPWQMDP